MKRGRTGKEKVIVYVSECVVCVCVCVCVCREKRRTNQIISLNGEIHFLVRVLNTCLQIFSNLPHCILRMFTCVTGAIRLLRVGNELVDFLKQFYTRRIPSCQQRTLLFYAEITNHPVDKKERKLALRTII
jgi:hypothetical protein